MAPAGPAYMPGHSLPMPHMSARVHGCMCTFARVHACVCACICACVFMRAYACAHVWAEVRVQIEQDGGAPGLQVI